MAEISYEDLTAGLRSWVRRRGEHEQAAVELLIWHETWLRRPDFKDACITQLAPGLVAVDWREAREFIDRGYRQKGQRPLPAASSHNRILDIAVAIGENEFGLAGLGRAHRRAAAEAFAAACGVTGVLLPTWPEIESSALSHLDAARTEMSSVRDWLISDWKPLGTPLTPAQAEARDGVLRIVGQVKDLIDEAKGLLHHA
jgi:hypothetical protein